MRPEGVDDFNSYIDRGKVNKKKEDIPTAKSLFFKAKRKFDNMEKLGIDKETSSDYFENLYESVKMLIQSFMELDGYHPYSHEAIVAYSIDILGLEDAVVNRLNRFRKMRNDMIYRGDIATENEARDIKELFIELWGRFEQNFEERIS